MKNEQEKVEPVASLSVPECGPLAIGFYRGAFDLHPGNHNVFTTPQECPRRKELGSQLKSCAAGVKISIPTYGMEQEFLTHYRRGYEAGKKELEAEITRLTKERDHWKANHDNRVEAARLLIERNDLPIERVQAYQKRIELQAEIAQQVERIAGLEAESAEYAPLQSRCFEGYASCSDGIFDFAKQQVVRITLLESDYQKAHALMCERTEQLAAAEGVIEKCRLPLEINLVFMDTPVNTRKVQPYTETYDALKAIAAHREGK